MKFSHHSVAFDIETEGLDKDIVLERTAPFPEFDSASVKLGDCRTDEARADKLARAEEDHRRKSQEHYDRAVDRAALAAETGRVLTIAYLPMDAEQAVVDFDDDEGLLLRRFWAAYRQTWRARGHLVGHNISDIYRILAGAAK